MNCSTETLRQFAARYGKSVEYWESVFQRGDNYDWGLVSQADEDYPFLIDSNNGAKIEISTVKNGEKPNRKGVPEFLFYRGDITLLNRENFIKNIAVIGLINPTDDIILREQRIVTILVNQGANIVSGLANGCDSIAHRTCLDNGGKTIAVLPSQINKVVPAENSALAEEIVAKGGLLVSEYFTPPDLRNKYEVLNRFIERDRLQAYFSNSILLIASYRHSKPGEVKSYPKDGKKRDSGARHAMEIAGKFGRKRFVMLNEKNDSGNEMFDLNRDILESKGKGIPAKVLSSATIHGIMNRIPTPAEQLGLFSES
jgi:DNA processing protein